MEKKKSAPSSPESSPPQKKRFLDDSRLKNLLPSFGQNASPLDAIKIEEPLLPLVSIKSFLNVDDILTDFEDKTASTASLVVAKPNPDPKPNPVPSGPTGGSNNKEIVNEKPPSSPKKKPVEKKPKTMNPNSMPHVPSTNKDKPPILVLNTNKNKEDPKITEGGFEVADGKGGKRKK